MQTAWESELASFLSHLSAVQDQSLEILSRKREMLVAADAQGLADVAREEQELVEKLQQCLKRRQQLLQQAEAEGFPADSIRSLAAALPAEQKRQLAEQVQQAAARARLLQHHSLTNWVLVQRTLIHLSQMLEIMATGGIMQPTYGKGPSAEANGALVDREV